MSHRRFKAKSKYGNMPTFTDGIRFASLAEARRYGELKLLQKAGEIQDLQLQPRYKMVVDGWLICTYVADFSYRDGKQKIAEDVKGMETALFKIKRKLFHALYPGIELIVSK